MSTPNEPLALDLEAEFSTRRPVTINEHALFINSLLTEADHDEIDALVDDDYHVVLDEEIQIDPYECHAPSRRSDKEVANLLDLLDNLETGNDRKETTR